MGGGIAQWQKCCFLFLLNSYRVIGVGEVLGLFIGIGIGIIYIFLFRKRILKSHIEISNTGLY